MLIAMRLPSGASAKLPLTELLLLQGPGGHAAQLLRQAWTRAVTGPRPEAPDLPRGNRVETAFSADLCNTRREAGRVGNGFPVEKGSGKKKEQETITDYSFATSSGKEKPKSHHT